MFCKYCGAKLSEDAAFCANCGKPVESSQPAAQPAQPKQNEKKTSKETVVMLVVIIAVALIIMAVVGAVTDLFSGIDLSGEGNATLETTLPQVTDPTAPLEGNPYQECFETYNNFVLSGSDSSYKNYKDVENLSDAACRIALQEIYARHGARFEDPQVQAYFDVRSWYVPSGANYELNAYEQANVALLQTYQAMRDGTLSSEENPYLAFTEDYVIPYSDTQRLQAPDINKLTLNQLVIARNEILARHGYIFSSEVLRQYFYTKSWYKPSVPGDEFNYGVLGSTETKNINLLKTYEKDVAFRIGELTVPVYDQYTYTHHDEFGDGCYHIPYLALPGVADSINKTIYNRHYQTIREYVINEAYSASLRSTVYNAGQKGNIVSIVVREYYVWEYNEATVYNIDITSGMTVSAKDVFAEFGMTEKQGREAIKKAMTKYLDRTEGTPNSTEEAELLRELRELTLSTENINRCNVFISPKGGLCFAGYIYIPAGAGCYEFLFDKNGYALNYNCKIHE